MNAFFILLPLLFALCSAQFYYQQSAVLPLAYQPHHQHNYEVAAPPSVHQNYAHPSVIENSMRESQLPPELSKSDRFYKNPRIAAALAKESWFTDKEMPVLDREAEKIPREMVYKIFKNAGYIKRR